MKKLLLFVFISLFFLQSKAQDPQLYENDWYLHNLIIDGEDNIPPVNEEIPYVLANFHFSGAFETGMCESGGGGQLIYIGTTEFTILNMGWLLGGCYQNEPFNEMYNMLYQSFWEYSQDDVFNYEIIYDGQNRTLIITNIENDQAIFGDVLLSVDDINKSTFYIYPNPVKDILTIGNTSSHEITSIKLYDVLGRLVLVENNIINQLDVSNLNSGLLFVRIETDKGVLTKKIIKK